MYIHMFVCLCVCVCVCVCRLDPALIRPGRVDVKQLIGYATGHQLVQMFRRFYPTQSEAAAREFSSTVLHQERTVSMAQIQGHFMFYKTDPAKALENIDQIWTQ